MDIICAGEMLIDFTPMQQRGLYGKSGRSACECSDRNGEKRT